ncbi:AfsR/SARP family transcriptional regulator [Mycobacterium sp. 050134]|uniref:AfsR/SARP family transcriptional regulator n=1 Tax=Mycobacterium sp. 050134 TaxID=3096111 RepID=UPI002ED77D60
MRSSDVARCPEEYPQLSLFGGFSLRIGGDAVTLPRHARRVLAFLSLDKIVERDCDRGVLAERLWTDAPVPRARASLRTALWRIRQASPALVCDSADRIALGNDVQVDVHRLRAEAEQLLCGYIRPNHASLASGCAVLLPGWDEEWLLLAREQLRQLRLHALEATGRRLIQSGHYQAAIDVMLGVVAEEPLRESAQSVLIEAHIGDGNMSEARRQFDIFAAMLWRELRLHASAELRCKVGLTPTAAAPGPAPERRDITAPPLRAHGFDTRPVTQPVPRRPQAWRT